MSLSDATYNELVSKAEEIERNRKDEQVTYKTIRAYVCPDPSCPSYYGSTEMSNLAMEPTGHRGMNGEHWPDEGHSRAQCPNCRANGKRVERCLIAVRVGVPIKAPTAPTLQRLGITRPPAAA